MNFQNHNIKVKNEKLSVIAIEQSIFHRLEIRHISEFYKLNIKIKKPIILILSTLSVAQHLQHHTQYLNALLKMDNIHSISFSVPGFGVFNQEDELQHIGNLFQNFALYSESTFDSLKEINLSLSGWRTLSSSFISHLFSFVNKCSRLEEFSLNISHTMDLNPKKKDNQSEEEYYGKKTFKTEEFQLLLKEILQLPLTMNLLNLKMSGWEGVDTVIVDLLTHYLKTISKKMVHLSTLKLDLNGWNQEGKIAKESIEGLLHCIEEFENLNMIMLDLRNWNNDQRIKKFKQFFGRSQIRKEENNWNGTGTNFASSFMKSFFGSNLKTKQMKNIKVVILD